jgi:sigma-B regulation protein RsbU (phosphoserine phosphatase)
MPTATVEVETAQSSKHLQCMEIWGGNRFVESSVELPGLDAWVYSRPHGGDERGGDVHYVSSCASGQIARVLVADEAGHGAKVSDTAERLRRLMRRHVNDHDQVRLMRSLNREFAAVSVAGRFATAVAFTFDATRGKLIVSNAGHPPPLWYRGGADSWGYLEPKPSASTEADESGPLDVPFGIEDAVDYGRFEVQLQPRDAVVVYTDSLTEARFADGGLLGLEGLLDVASGFGPIVTPDRLVRTLLERVTERTGQPFSDDVTVLVFRANGRRRRIPLYDRLLAPVRYVRGLPGTFFP